MHGKDIYERWSSNSCLGIKMLTRFSPNMFLPSSEQLCYALHKWVQTSTQDIVILPAYSWLYWPSLRNQVSDYQSLIKR